MKNKFLSLLLALVLVFSLAAITASAEDTTILIQPEETTLSEVPEYSTAPTGTTAADMAQGIGDAVGEIMGEELKDGQDEALSIMYNGQSFMQKFVDIIEGIKDAIVNFINLFVNGFRNAVANW